MTLKEYCFSHIIESGFEYLLDEETPLFLYDDYTIHFEWIDIELLDLIIFRLTLLNVFQYDKQDEGIIEKFAEDAYSENYPESCLIKIDKENNNINLVCEADIETKEEFRLWFAICLEALILTRERLIVKIFEYYNITDEIKLLITDD